MIVASMTDGEMVRAGSIGGEVSSSTRLAMVEGSRDEYQCRAFAAGRGGCAVLACGQGGVPKYTK
jgi:hypothetical protein